MAASATLQPPRSIPRGITSAFDLSRVPYRSVLRHRRRVRAVYTKVLKEREQRVNGFHEALNLRTESEIVEAIRELKLVDDPEKLRELLKIWRASF
jgi:hypothetical protein